MRRLLFLWWDFWGYPGHPEDWPDDYFAHRYPFRKRGQV